MKKMFLTLIVAVALLSGCTAKDNHLRDSGDTDIIVSTVSPTNTEKTAVTERNGQMENNNTSEPYTEAEYDKDGNLKSNTYFNADGNQIKYIWYKDDGSISYWEEYEYDKAGDRIKSSCFNADGTIASWVESEYDEDH